MLWFACFVLAFRWALLARSPGTGAPATGWARGALCRCLMEQLLGIRQRWLRSLLVLHAVINVRGRHFRPQ